MQESGIGAPVEEFLDLPDQSGQVRFENSPDYLVGYRGVRVDQAVPKSDYAAGVGDPAGQFGL